MKAIVIVHSETGNTKLFADSIKNSIEKRNIECTLVQIKTDIPMRNYNPSKQSITITNMPEVEGFDYVLVGGPVMGFQANPVIMKCLREMKSLSGKKFIPFVTQHFPFKFMGGSNAISMMSKSAEKSGAVVLSGSVINISWHDYKKDILKKSDEISLLIQTK